MSCYYHACKDSIFLLIKWLPYDTYFQNSQIHPDEVEDDNEVMLISDFNVDEIKSDP